MKRTLAAVTIVIAIALVAALAGKLSTGVRYVQARLTPRATVEDRLREFESAAKQRIAPAFQAKGFSWPLSNLALVVIKDRALLQLFTHDSHGRPRHIKDYPMLAKSGTLGPKLREGDRQIPEGIYRVAYLNPNSLYHLSLRLNYPNEFDRRMAQRDGRSKLGGDIMIHGKNVSIGCVAIGDPGIEEIFCLAARAGLEHVKVIIVPTDWRQAAFDPRAIAGPDWLPELYRSLSDELQRFK